MISKELKIDKSDYTLDGKIYVRNINFTLIEELISRNQKMGVGYGEFGIRDNLSLSSVSHIIEDIQLNKKSSTLYVKCRVLSTMYGMEVKEIIDDHCGPNLRMSLRYAKGSSGIKKIFTVDLILDWQGKTLEEKLRNERRAKLEKINEISEK